MSDKKPSEEEVTIVPIEVRTADLAEVMSEESSKRALITAYIAKHMTSGTDFGTISFGGRESKPSLFKPGSEKFISLFKLTARFQKDSDTWEMAGSEAGVFCYVCTLYTSSGSVAGEGRGVAKLNEKAGWTINNAVKIAEKRAQIDAVLRTGALSDFFTQDLEDMKGVTVPSPARAFKSESFKPFATTEEPPVPSTPRPIPNDIKAQREQIRDMLKARGVDVSDKKACERYVADETQLALTEGNFAAIIGILKVKKTL